jgi:aminoglycoside 3-N-acetyltransferase
MSLLERLFRNVRRRIPHRASYYRDTLRQRTTATELGDLLVKLGLKRGSVALVNSSFSSLGYFVGGARRLIELLRELVGDEGSIVMPAIPFDGSMEEYVGGNPVWDLKETPSKSGHLTEVFRNYPGVIRSVHPTHSACALGRHAEEITADHERCDTPCGEMSPWGRLAKLNTRAVRLGTGGISLLHYVQEAVNFPNLFLPASANLQCKLPGNKSVVVKTRIYRKLIPFVIFLGEDQDSQLLSVNLIDYPLLYTGGRELIYRQNPNRQEMLTRLLSIREEFNRSGLLGMGELGKCKCEVVDGKALVDFSIRELNRLIAENRQLYDIERIERLLKDGKLPL